MPYSVLFLINFPSTIRLAKQRCLLNFVFHSSCLLILFMNVHGIFNKFIWLALSYNKKKKKTELKGTETETKKCKEVNNKVFTFKKSIVRGFCNALAGIFSSNGSKLGGTGKVMPFNIEGKHQIK